MAEGAQAGPEEAQRQRRRHRSPRRRLRSAGAAAAVPLRRRLRGLAGPPLPGAMERRQARGAETRVAPSPAASGFSSQVQAPPTEKGRGKPRAANRMLTSEVPVNKTAPLARALCPSAPLWLAQIPSEKRAERKRAQSSCASLMYSLMSASCHVSLPGWDKKSNPEPCNKL
ncbi:uncharacterized protein LOC114586166 isoform X1 [Podarcis muralis]